MSKSIKPDQPAASNAKSEDLDNNVKTDFDLDSLRLKQISAITSGVKKVLTIVPVRKPGKAIFVRVNPSEDYKMPCALVELKEQRETYLITPNMMGVDGISELVKPYQIVTTITRQGDIALWPLRLPDTEGRALAWHTSAIEAAEIAEKQWTRVEANMGMGVYQPYVATGDLPEPEWPDYTFAQLVEKAFKGYIVNTEDHPLIATLTGAR